MNNKKKLMIGVIVALIIIVVILAFIFLNNNKEEVVVNYDEVKTLYDNLDKEGIAGKNCEERKYISKLYGYSYDNDGNVQMNVMEGYTENNKVYDLDGKEIGKYSKDTLNEVLDKGTLKTYNYDKNGDNYKLQK